MGVTILGVLGITIGLLSIGGGATVLATSSDVAALALNAVAVLLGVLFLVSGIGFFQGKKWAWTLGLLVGVLSIFRNLVEAAQGLVVTAVPGIVLAVIVVYYLTTPSVKTYFGRGAKS